MTLSQMYTYANNNNITLSYFSLKNKLAFSAKIDNAYHIILNNKILFSLRNERSVLAEEIGHCIENTLYYLDDHVHPFFKLRVDKAERRAKDWAASHIVEWNDLSPLLSLEIYEIAEELNVTENIVVGAIDYYRRKNYLTV